MRLSILICTLNEPHYITRLRRLNNILDPQLHRYKGQVNKLINDAGRAMPTGTKRNHLIKDSDSDYFCFIDSDDLVPVFYVDEIMRALESNPDVVTFCGHMTTNGKHSAPFEIKLGNPYIEKNGVYYRWPNHLCVMRRSLVESVKFPDLWQQEDYQWSEKIHRMGLLKTETHISKSLYTYDFITNKPNVARSRVR